MKQPVFIKRSNLPPSISVLWPLTWWLILDRFSAPPWLYGVVFTLVAIVYVVEVARAWTGKSVDVLEKEQ